MLRLGLCTGFLNEPIRFRTQTARYARTLSPAERLRHLRALALHNVHALEAAIGWCAEHGVGAFRITSGLIPLYTHPEVGWTLARHDRKGELRAGLRRAGAAARAAGVRLSFHPDQFVVLGSPTEESVVASLAELEYQAECALLLGAEQLTIHGGGAQGGKQAALARLAAGLARLSPAARGLIALENDDRVYTVRDLLPICGAPGLPLVYDVHHHRCNPDGLDILEATTLAAATWGGREPWAHLSSPAAGWTGGDPRPHADVIASRDVPREWLGRDLTVDVEAKHKDLAVLRLRRWLLRASKG